MSKQTEPGSAFAPATGYATTVDAALAMSARTKDIMQHEKQYMRNEFERAMHALADEVHRLRAEVAGLENKLSGTPSTCA